MKLSDVVTSTLTTARGETIILTHDTNLPRPIPLVLEYRGARFSEFDYYTQRVHIEGVSEITAGMQDLNGLTSTIIPMEAVWRGSRKFRAWRNGLLPGSGFLSVRRQGTCD